MVTSNSAPCCKYRVKGRQAHVGRGQNPAPVNCFDKTDCGNSPANSRPNTGNRLIPRQLALHVALFGGVLKILALVVQLFAPAQSQFDFDFPGLEVQV